MRGLIVVAAFLVSWPLAARGVSAAENTQIKNDALDDGFQDMYNLQFDAAHAAFQRYEQLHPEDPMGPVSNAAAFLFFEFDRMNILRSDFFVRDKTLLNSKKQQPDAKIKAAFEAELAKARQLTKRKLQKSPGDHNALLAKAMATALHADYAALVEKQYWKALNEIKQAQAEAQQLLKICPDCYDAYLPGGVENYLLSQKAAPTRWLLKLTGAQTDKQTGIGDLRIVAEKGHYFKPYARVLLAITALRDNNKQEARQLLVDLGAKFPKNDLFRDELKKMDSGNHGCG